MHRPRRILLSVICVPLLLGASAQPASSVAVSPERLRIADPVRHWRDYLPLVPTIHPPTTHDHGDLIQVWLHVPPGRRIDARWLEDQQRHTLVYPPGTVADRVEYYFIGEQPPALDRYAPFHPGRKVRKRWSVADVRGTRLMADGSQLFHVYRPDSGEAHASLSGWAWPRNDPTARQRATDALVRHAATTIRPLGDEPMDADGLAALRRLNDCASCHQPDLPRIRLAGAERSIGRATDSLGFVVPNAVLRNSCVVADHRPEDVNQEDPFVTVRCADGAAARLRDEDGERFECADGSQPRGHRDVAAGLAAGHPYTEAVCASRRGLHSRMTTRARHAFRDAFAACGIR